MEHLRDIFVENFDVTRSITVEQFKSVVNTYKDDLEIQEAEIEVLVQKLFENANEISIESLLLLLDQNIELLQTTHRIPTNNSIATTVSTFICDNLQEILFMSIIFVIQGIRIYQAFDYTKTIEDPTSRAYNLLARACGFNLDFLIPLEFLFMIRKTITFLRINRLNKILPLDDAIDNHKFVGYLIGIYSIGHTVGQILIRCAKAAAKEQKCIDYLFLLNNGKSTRLVYTGLALLVMLFLMVVTSLPWVRRSGYFEVFYFTHLLYYPFVVVTIVHYVSFWKWIIGPGILFVLEQLYRIFALKLGYTFVVEGVLLPSRVIHLVIKRPPDFNFNPGDWVYIRIPRIAWFEAHPFTISSAPEMLDNLWLHIRANEGGWTGRLYEYLLQNTVKTEETRTKGRPKPRLRPQTIAEFGKRGSYFALPKPPEEDRRQSLLWRVSNIRGPRASNEEDGEGRYSESAFLRHPRNAAQVIKLNEPLEVILEGPYGSPTTDLFFSEHAVMIAGGIGVTPYASILQNIMFRYQKTKMRCPACQHSWHAPIPDGLSHLKKLDFVWINRDRKSFEWFVNLLSDLEMIQALQGNDDRFLDMHLYLTSAQNKRDTTIFGLQLALDLAHREEKRHLIQGLKSRTHPGRPDFATFFQQIKDQKKGRVTIFYCGPSQLGRTIRRHCLNFGFTFCQEIF